MRDLAVREELRRELEFLEKGLGWTPHRSNLDIGCFHFEEREQMLRWEFFGSK